VGVLAGQARRAIEELVVESKPRSVRAEQSQLSHAMRLDGCSWRQIADEFVVRWSLTYLQAFRLVHGLSQVQAAERYNTKWQPNKPLTGKHISYWEMWPSKSGKEPSLSKLRMLADVYECSLSDLLIDADDHERVRRVNEDRRTFVRLAGASFLSAILDAPSDKPALDAAPLAGVLAAHSDDIGSEQSGAPPDVSALAANVHDVRRRYQACHYSELAEELPRLLACLHAACRSLAGDARRYALTLSADAYHVAAGLLLKIGDQGLVHLAADRSMQAAKASEDPITIGASARIITHAFMSGGHLAAAITTASDHASRLGRESCASTPESLSVYGSFLLRGAAAAAQHDQRATAYELLDEADEAAKWLGVDGNLRWTAFGPTNAKQHRVNIAVTLGDAGTAVDVARGIDLSAITVTERKASLLIDTARAFLQWGRHEKAYVALRAAEEVAHEEVAGRPVVRRLVRELVTSAPPSIRRDVGQFAAQVGVFR
jgi:transcriptional regulator with XRE-family HTH domain